MSVQIDSPTLDAGATTYGAFLRRVSDGYIWNNSTGAWQAAPSNANAFIALTDRGGVFAGLYRGANSGDLGNAAAVEITMHDSSRSYAVVPGTGMLSVYVWGGSEIRVPATDASGGALGTLANQQTIAGYLDTEIAAILAAVDTEIAAIKDKTDNLPASPAAVGSAMTLANGAITTASIADGAITDAKFTVPTVSGVATGILGMIVQTFRRFFGKTTLTTSQLKTFADDGSTVVTTQTVSDDGTTQTQGAAS